MARTFPLAAATLAALLPLAGAAHAATSATVVLQVGAPHYQAYPVRPVQYRPPPPPPRYERAPAARHSMVWSQGYWQWHGQRYAWVPGHWQKLRAGQYYRQPRWEQHRGHWQFTGGGWERGAPAYPGPRPGNPYRY
ncbi:MAG TPA: hypothetical protein PLL92_03695 [Alicycliphilus sp.]|nr:hypothetical protein [Alicycliphilus sp.]